MARGGFRTNATQRSGPLSGNGRRSAMSKTVLSPSGGATVSRDVSPGEGEGTGFSSVVQGGIFWFWVCVICVCFDLAVFLKGGGGQSEAFLVAALTRGPRFLLRPPPPLSPSLGDRAHPTRTRARLSAELRMLGALCRRSFPTRLRRWGGVREWSRRSARRQTRWHVA